MVSRTEPHELYTTGTVFLFPQFIAPLVCLTDTPQQPSFYRRFLGAKCSDSTGEETNKITPLSSSTRKLISLVGLQEYRGTMSTAGLNIHETHGDNIFCYQ